MGDKYKDGNNYEQGNIEPVYIDLIGRKLTKEGMPFYPGLMGEAAFYRYMRWERSIVDFPKPDVAIYGKTGLSLYDFLYRSKKYEVKTSTSGGPALVKILNQQFEWDILVSAYHKPNTNAVNLRGWQEVACINQLKPQPSYNKNGRKWFNKEVNSYCLKSMESIYGT